MATSKDIRRAMIADLRADIRKLDEHINARKFKAKGTLALMSFRKILKGTIACLEKRGL